VAEYFESRLAAERLVHEWFVKDQIPPVFFGTILNHGSEEWLVSYDARQNPRCSPFIRVLADHSGEIRRIVNMPWEQHMRELGAGEQREEQQRRDQQRRDEERRSREAHIAEVRRQRAVVGQCSECGRQLGLLGSIFHHDRHRGCKQFSD
jgi:hypothetical protein